MTHKAQHIMLDGRTDCVDGGNTDERAYIAPLIHGIIVKRGSKCIENFVIGFTDDYRSSNSAFSLQGRCF